MARKKFVPPRMIKLRKEQRPNLPPRLLKLRQEQQAQATSVHARHVLPVEYLPCWSDMFQLQRASVEHIALLQQQLLLEQQAVPVEKQIQEEQQRQKKKKEEENRAEEISTVDYSRLTSFLERDDSFLAPWNWNPEENKQQSKTDLYFSFNVRERWALQKKDNIDSKVFARLLCMNCEELQNVLSTTKFEKLDRNGDGLVSLEELNWVLERVGVHYSLEELETRVEQRSLDFNEFLFFRNSIISSIEKNSTAAADKNDKSEEIRNNEEDNEESDFFKAFSVFDLNGDGFITSEELQNVLAKLGL